MTLNAKQKVLSTADAFEAAIDNNPDDILTQLAYADYLDDKETLRACAQCETVRFSEYGKKTELEGCPNCSHCHETGHVTTKEGRKAFDIRASALLRDVAANLHDDAPRYDYANLCERYGLVKRAEMVREQLRLNGLKCQFCTRVYYPSRGKSWGAARSPGGIHSSRKNCACDDTLHEVRQLWEKSGYTADELADAGGLRPSVAGFAELCVYAGPNYIDFRRGFPCRIEMQAELWSLDTYVKRIFSKMPTLERVFAPHLHPRVIGDKFCWVNADSIRGVDTTPASCRLPSGLYKYCNELFDTEEQAQERLKTYAWINWGRELVGLPLI